MADPFERRLRRAEVLRKEWPFATQILGLFSRLTEVQQEIWTYLEGPAPNDPEAKILRGLAFKLLDVLRRHAPGPLAERAEEMEDIELLLLEQRSAAGEPLDPEESFLLRVLEQPRYMSTVRLEGQERMAATTGTCPFCDLPPLVGVLREDKQADTVRRTLLCPRCCNEWDFPRVLCPSCREERPEKLPRYTAQEIPWMRVEACDTCHKYLKSVDLTQNWDADPIVDELASTPLDVIARDHGYTKIAPNLAGI